MAVAQSTIEIPATVPKVIGSLNSSQAQTEAVAGTRKVTAMALLAKHETSYSDSNLMLAAAMAGQGIAIGRSTLVEADIAAGRLVRLFDVTTLSPYAYYMVTALQRA